MDSLLEIEEAIGRLPQDQIMALVERLEQPVADERDRKFEQDVNNGRRDANPATCGGTPRPLVHRP